MTRRYWNINLKEMIEAGVHFGHFKTFLTDSLVRTDEAPNHRVLSTGARSKDTNRDSQTKRGIRSHFFLSRKKKGESIEFRKIRISSLNTKSF